MKIVLDARMLYFGGIGTYIRNIVHRLRHSFEITLLSYEPYLDLPFIKMSSAIYSVGEQWELFRKIPSCDIFWSPHYNVPILPVPAKKRVVIIHDVFHLANKHKLSFCQRIYAEYMIRRAVLKSDLIITVSDFSRREIIKYTGLDKKIAVVHNGLDHGLFRPESPKEPMKPVDSFSYLLFVGNVKPHKNLQNALAAFNLIQERYPDLYFLIVGQKKNLITADHEVLRLAANNNRVIFTGLVQEKELPALYSQACAFLFPSLYEGFGLPPLEAQSCNCPVISSNVASLPEVCGDSVLYCDPSSVEDIAQKLMLLLDDEGLQTELTARGRENIKRFSWEKTAEEISKELSGLLD